MKMKKCNFGSLKELCDVHKRGSSSFRMHDTTKIFSEINLKSGDSVLDLGCGPGDYSLEIAKIVGQSGTVYSLDKQEELLFDLKGRTSAAGLKNIKTIPCDITSPLILGKNSINACLIATVLHIPGVSEKREDLFSEVYRVLKPDGKLITVDVKKENTSFGPPLAVRLEPRDIIVAASRSGFQKVKLVDLGYNFMLVFTVVK
jgi:ubiquinone/menaquinone biosynthesis C-methylase UbiE